MVRAEVEPVSDGYRVTTYADEHANGWGVGITFRTARAAQMVATAIELAATDEDDR